MNVRVVASWSALGVDLSAVDAALRRLRASPAMPARCGVLTLVAIVDDDLSAAVSVTEVIRELARYTSAHTLILAADVDQEPGLDARVTARICEGAGTSMCLQDVLLHIRGPAAARLDVLVEPLRLPGQPVVVWLLKRLPRPDEPVLATADRVLVDSRSLDAPRSFTDLLMLSRRLPVTDLSWVRLEPWRALIAGLFLGADFSRFLGGILRVDAEGTPGLRSLLAGWLASRLRLDPSLVHFADAEAIAVHIRAQHRGQQATFTVERSDEELVHATAAIAGGPSHRRLLPLPSWPPVAVLDRALARSRTDEAWRQAASGAIALTGQGAVDL